MRRELRAGNPRCERLCFLVIGVHHKVNDLGSCAEFSGAASLGRLLIEAYESPKPFDGWLDGIVNPVVFRRASPESRRSVLHSEGKNDANGRKERETQEARDLRGD